jgi:ATP-dependent RNA helicase DeaD
MSDEIFDQSRSFKDLGLRDSVLRGVEAIGFEHPTDIQVKLIEPIMAGKDVLGQAKTGTGKTAAFGLPILHMADPNTPMQALILAPTRELAAQVASELDELGKFTPIRTSCIIGGESMREQSQSVQRGGHIIVGTPGRVMDMHGRRQITFDNLRFAVLDEVDRMLDIGFRDDIRKILSSIKRPHQTIFVSATIDEAIERLGRTFMQPDAQKIMTVSGSLTVSLVDQKFLTVEAWDKKQLLLHLLKKEQPQTTVVFCRTKATVDKLSHYLRDKGVDVRHLHGDMPQVKRTKVMDKMRSGSLSVLIASDLAARGLDVEHITHVINYDLPEDPEVYVHRIGRTARAGRRGTAWSFTTPEEGQRLTDIEKLTGAMIEQFHFEGFQPGPVPQDVRELREKSEKRRTGPKTNLERTVAPEVGGLSEDELAKMFPGGVVPQNAPKVTIGSRLKSRRKR